MQFLVTAYDGKDEEAMQRRMTAREAHLEGVKTLRAQGTFINGGAILDDAGQMIGSTLYMEFGTREELDAWLHADPYYTGRVWLDVKIQPIRLVPQN